MKSECDDDFSEMGNCAAKPIPHERRQQMHSRQGLLRNSRSRLDLAQDDKPESRKPGTVSTEAVRWFMDRDERTLTQATSFIPRVIRQGIGLNAAVTESTDSVVAYRGEGAIVFCDASGFTKLTERLAQKENGAELLSQVLNQFYTPLVALLLQYRGDIIKFSGDALTVFFVSEPPVDTNESSELDPLPCGSKWAQCSGHSSLALATLRASACCLEIHRRLDHFQVPGVPGASLSFHIGVGCGNCVVLHVGGQNPPEDPRTKRFEYVICGDPLEQISHACKYALVGETVLSPSAWGLVKDTCIEGPLVTEDALYHRLQDLNPAMHSYACIRAAAAGMGFQMDPVPLRSTRRYIPAAVYMQMENGTLEYVNELRVLTVFFMSVVGVDVASLPGGPVIAQELMSIVQRACHEQEGQVNKFLVDDKGLLFLCVFGAPPMVHTDDPLRAINACFRIIESLKHSAVVGGKSAFFGLTTGRVFCGLVGSPARQEYTTLGDSVNLAARLMQLGMANKVVVDASTFEFTKEAFEYAVLPPVVLKGKGSPVPIFCPEFLRGRVGPKDPDKILACKGWPAVILAEKFFPQQSGRGLVLAGPSGLGASELSRYVVGRVEEAHGNLAKIFASDEGIGGEKSNVALQLLESCLIGVEVGGGSNVVQRVCGWLGTAEDRCITEGVLVEYCELAVKKILQTRPVAIVLKSIRGTSLFNVDTSPVFWEIVQRLGAMITGPTTHPLFLVVVCGDQNELKNACMQSKFHVIELAPLDNACIEEYISLSLQVTPPIPSELLTFVQDLTQGIPLYVRETLDQLLQRNNISISPSKGVVLHRSLASINLTEWSHTSMVGRVICQLEALAPQEATVVKMASVFEGPFSVLDIAASLKSPYTNATCFDNYRMFRTCHRLVSSGILTPIPHLPIESSLSTVLVNDMSRFPLETDPVFLESMRNIPLYILDNYLIRKVARGMILHQQAMKVKRQALMFRALHKDLPAHMKAYKARMARLDIHYFDIVRLQ